MDVSVFVCMHVYPVCVFVCTCPRKQPGRVRPPFLPLVDTRDNDDVTTADDAVESVMKWLVFSV